MVHEDLNKRLDLAEQGVNRINKIEKMLVALDEDNKQLDDKIKQLKEVLDKEKYDVEKLDSGNITKLFYSILGNFDEKKEKEQQEYLAAKLKYEQAIRDLSNITRRISSLKIEKSEYINCKKEYEILYKQKKQLLMENNSAVAEQIMKLTSEKNKVYNNIKELEEARNAGEDVLNCLNKAFSSLESAKGWGTWDMLGGGLISDLAKHSHIDNAMAEVEQAQSLLLKFRNELSDVNINTDIFIETQGFLKFADFFFDGLIADWSMQSKINNARVSTENVLNEVKDITTRISKLEHDSRNKVMKIDYEIDKLIKES